MKFVTSKSSWKNEVDVKSVYMMSSEFGLRSGKSMLKNWIAGGVEEEGVQHFKLKSLTGGSEVVIVWNK